MQLILHQVELPLRYPFTIAHGSQTTARSLIVELRDGHLVGYGEASESSYYGYTVARSVEALEQCRTEIEAVVLDGDSQQPWPERLWAQLDPRLGDYRTAQSALDQAAWDLWGKRQGKPLYELWGLDPSNNRPTDYTIGIDRVETMVAKLLEFSDWPIFKIKVGTADDMQVLRALRNETSAPFRVDANCGWQASTALEMTQQLAALGVELIEQPLPAGEWDAMRQLVAASALPLMADESCVVEADVPRCPGHFHGINVKLCKCGGLTPARRMLLQARELGLRTMVGCMTETTVGISAAAHLMPLCDFVDLDGALLLAEDVADGVTFTRGVVHYPNTPGTGVTLRQRAV